MNTYMITDLGEHVPVIPVDAFVMSDGRKMAVVDATCNGRYQNRCQAITCEASMLVRLQSDEATEAEADMLLDLYDRTHPGAILADECYPWDELQGCELAHLGINY